MSSSTSNTHLSHRRTHNLLLISKLLNQRDAASPFTLVLDTLEQTAGPLLVEYVRRANVAKTCTIFLAFETVRKPAGVDFFVPCWNKAPDEIVGEIQAVVLTKSSPPKRHHLLIIDSLHPLCVLSSHPSSSSSTFNLTQFLSSLIAPTQPNTSTTSLVAVYHTDIPLLSSPTTTAQIYQPTPLSLLTYLATTVLTLHSLATLLAARAAQARSQAPPVFGLEAGREGIVIGLKPAKYTKHLPPEQRGVVLELEHRRKSGRGVREWYFLPAHSPSSLRTGQGANNSSSNSKDPVTLLDDHPLFRPQKPTEDAATDNQLAGLTFELGLTDRQRLERDGVVLPYFDAQRDGGAVGPGEGGRILYDMGSEDDFDEEEDEI